MGMSVALEGDARQAAAVKLAEEHGLVRNAQAGDRLAFEELVRRYDRDVLRLAAELGPPRAKTRATSTRKAFCESTGTCTASGSSAASTPGCTASSPTSRSIILRRRTSRREDQAPVPEETDGGSTRDFFDRQPELRPAANPERQLLGQELGQHISAALNRLSPRERMVFEMKHYQGLKLRAIGDLLGTSEETVKNSLFRATRKLRASLEFMR